MVTITTVKTPKPVPAGYREVFSKYITVQGRRIYAAQKGLRAFRFLVKK